MKNIIITMAFILTGTAYANSAKITALDSDNKKVTIELDSKKTPRLSSDLKSYPTIKDFRDGSDYSDVCYSGKKTDAQELLKALVNAANGDGDSWASLVSLKSDAKSKFTVIVSISDESGENEEEYQFPACI